MAKGKHSVALFEVIHNDKRFNTRRGVDPMKTPTWWFKSPASAGGLHAKEPIVSRTLVHPLALPAHGAGQPPSDASPTEFDPTYRHQGDEHHGEKFDPTAEIPPLAKPIAETAANSVMPASPMRRSATRGRGLSAKDVLTRSSAAIIGVAVAAVVSGAVMLGRTHQPVRIDTASVPDPQSQQPVRPDVMQNINADTAPPDSDAADTPAPATPTDTAQPNDAPATPAAVPPVINAMQQQMVSGRAQRQNNLNYVVIQSYADEKLADDAATFLNAHGVGATVEHGLPGWGHMYSVLGVDGFAHISAPAFKLYMQKVRALSRDFAPSKNGHGESYKAFDPIAMKWNHAE
jgi:hypothetical protein